MKLSEARGKLVVIGGAEDKRKDCTILKEFLRMAHGARARIVVMTVATNSPEEVGEEYCALFKKLGVDDVEYVDVSSRADAADEKSIEKIRRATGLFFTGGDQLHVTSLLGGTEMQKVVHERYEKGTVIGGTSAGAAMMSNSMILGGASDENPRMEAVEIGPGMDLIVGAVIDTHFSQRGRHGRLLTAVAHYPQDLGIGIDEDTALLVNCDEFEIVGSGAVTIIDAGAMTYTSVPYAEKGESLSLHGVALHVLGAGQRFDLANRCPIIPEDAKGVGGPKSKPRESNGGARRPAKRGKAR